MLIAEVIVATREGHIVAKERGEFMAVAYKGNHDMNIL